MKLEIKHLAPYLPYKLKLYNRQGIIRTMYTFESNDKYINIEDVDCLNYKPILRPLDALKSPITHNGKTFIALHELLKDNCFNLEKMTEERINEFEATFIDAYSWSYKDAITLCSWHYDIFNLIEKGLAIDINSLSLADA